MQQRIPRSQEPPRRAEPDPQGDQHVYGAVRVLRRYLDWNRYTFEYHAIGKRDDAAFDYNSGTRVSNEITEYRKQLNLGELYGCVPDSYCQTCVPFEDPKNIFTLLSDALATSVVNPAQADKVRYVFCNTGGIRLDLYKGPFTYDDNFIVSPFRDVSALHPRRAVPARQRPPRGPQRTAAPTRRGSPRCRSRATCADPVVAPLAELKARGLDDSQPRGVTRRQVVDLDPSYTTKDDFGTDGDDTAHGADPRRSGCPTTSRALRTFRIRTMPEVADVVFVDL